MGMSEKTINPRIADERKVAANPKVIDALRKVLPAECVVASEAELRPYECDALTVFRQPPLVVVMPETTEQVQEVMKICHQFGTPVVARGAGTGLSGGALPLADGVLLSLAKFNDVLGINPDARTAVVQPGVRNISISESAAPYGLYYAPDPSSQIACTIGGNVAENAGGVHCLKYGLTVHNILKLTMVGVEGELYEVGSNALDNSGFDLLALITGSEGMLGVIVEVTVKLLPAPPATKTLLASFSQLEAAGDAVAKIIARGITPAGLEMMDNLAIGAAEDFAQAGYPKDAAAILICELDGLQEEVDADAAAAQEVLKSAGASDIRIATDEAKRELFWKGRKAAFPAVGRLSPDYFCMDGTIPRRELAAVLGRIAALSAEYGLRVANVFHAGDGNLHPLILFDASRAGELEKAEALGGAVLEVCVAAGGTISGEHGVGVEKLNQMCVQFNAAELAQMHAVKAAFDPHGALNPGKAVPTLHRCSEFGAMRVKSGAPPLPDLPRF